MFRWFAVCLLLAAGAVIVVAALAGKLPAGPTKAKADARPAEEGPLKPGPQAPGKVAADPEATERPVLNDRGVDVIWAPKPVVARERGQYLIVRNAHVLSDVKQEVPAEQDGKLIFLGTELSDKDKELIAKLKGEGKPMPPWYVEAELGFLAVLVHPGETVPPDQLVRFNGITKSYRRWKRDDDLVPGEVIVARQKKELRKLEVGTEVHQGQLLALVNPALALDDLAVKNASLEAAEADRLAAGKTKDEAHKLYLAKERTHREVRGAVSQDELRGAKLSWERYIQEELAKAAAVRKAQRELSAAMTKLALHEIRASIPGVVKTIYKSRGDAIKSLDQVLQLQNPNLLVVKGEIEVQDLSGLERGMEIIVEPSQLEGPQGVLSGHLKEVNAVAVSQGKNPFIVSASEDGTVRIWERESKSGRWYQRGLLRHHVPVRAVACTSPASKRNLILTSTSTGLAQVFNLDAISEGPRRLHGRHEDTINCVAFSPDGEVCATAGADRSICLWDTATGDQLHRIPMAHKNAVTALQFASKTRLMSAGQDRQLIVWDVESGHAPRSLYEFDRGGDVAQPSVSPDGKKVVVDHGGKELRVLSLDDRQILGSLQSPTTESNFSTMALFSPRDGGTILTTGAGPGQLQLWRAPTAETRGSLLRQFMWTNGAATCGAFAPESAFVATGTRDGKVLVWKMPSETEVSQRLTARIQAVEKFQDSSVPKVSIRAELVNPGWLIPGGTATMVIPRK